MLWGTDVTVQVARIENGDLPAEALRFVLRLEPDAEIWSRPDALLLVAAKQQQPRQHSGAGAQEARYANEQGPLGQVQL